MKDVKELTEALDALVRLDGKAPPKAPDLVALAARATASPWLRFALGVAAGEPLPLADADAVAHAAREFATDWAMWIAYRECVIEVAPPGGPSVKFGIDPAAGGREPETFPAATFAILTAWNPGSGEPRPNERANRRANEQLAAHLDARLYERWPAVNAPGARWREESFAVLGIDLDEAHRIAEAYQQRAFYYVDRGRPLLAARRRGRLSTWEGSLRIR